MALEVLEAPTHSEVEEAAGLLLLKLSMQSLRHQVWITGVVEDLEVGVVEGEVYLEAEVV